MGGWISSVFSTIMVASISLSEGLMQYSIVWARLSSESSLWDYIYGDQFPDEEEYNEKVLPIRLKLDVYYVKHASFFGDLKLIVWTVLAILYTACGKYPQWMHERLVGYATSDVDLGAGNLDLDS